MKKIILALTLMIFVGIAQTSYATCDVQARSAEFSTKLQKIAQDNPEKFATIQPDLKALSTEIPAFIKEGKTDEVCKRYDEIEAKLK